MRRSLIALALAAVALLLFFLRDVLLEPVSSPLPATGPHAALDAGARGPATHAPVTLLAATVRQGTDGMSFSGQVLSSGTEQPVAGAELLFEHGGTAHTTRSTNDGRFTLTAIDDGEWHLVRIEAPGFHPYVSRFDSGGIALWATPGRRLEGLVFHLSPAVDLDGLVVDGAGQEVAGAIVAMLNPDGSEVLSRTVTDKAGTFLFRAPDEGIVEATHPDYLPGRARVGYRTAVTRTLTVYLGPRVDAGLALSPLSGQVVDAAGAELPGVLVTAEADEAEDPGLYAQQAETDLDGRFAFSLAPGAYAVTATRPGVVGVSALGTAGGPPLRLVLGAGATVRGRVRSDRGEPVTAFALVLSRRQGLERLDTQVVNVVHALGEFELGGVPPGSWVLAAAGLGYGPSAEKPLEVPPAGLAGVELTLGRGATLRGTVVTRGAGTPVPGARVSLESSLFDGSTPLRADARTDERGAFALEGLGPGRRSIYAIGPGHHARIVSAIEVPKDGDPPAVRVELTPLARGEEPLLELVGIGAVLKPAAQVLVIEQALPGGGAAEVGLGQGDEVLAVDGAPVAQLGFGGAVERIRGPEDSTVTLRIRRGESESELVVPRRRLQH